MKKLIIALVLCLTVSVASAEELTKKQKNKMLIFQGLSAIDMLQTIKIAKNPTIWGEMNPILGTHPAVGSVVLFFTARNVIHYVVVKKVPAKYKDAFINIPIIGQGFAVAWNIGNGLGLGF
jgi:hypothetical protein